jgi:hypothetical protein
MRGISAGIYFSMDKAVEWVHVSVDRPGALSPPWTDSTALTGAQPPAAPVRQSSPTGAQQREERTGSLVRASPGLWRRRGGRAMAVKAQWHRSSVGVLLRRGERGKDVGRGAVKLGGGARLL